MCGATWLTIRYHLGTIAFGSFIIALIQLMRIILAYIQNRYKVLMASFSSLDDPPLNKYIYIVQNSQISIPCSGSRITSKSFKQNMHAKIRYLEFLHLCTTDARPVSDTFLEITLAYIPLPLENISMSAVAKNYIHMLFCRLKENGEKKTKTKKFQRFLFAGRLRGKTTKLVSFLLKCLACCLWCFEKFMKFVNKNAYIMTGTCTCRCMPIIVSYNVQQVRRRVAMSTILLYI